MPAARKKDPSPAQLDEAERLDTLFGKQTELSQEKFGELYGLGTQGNVSQYLKGRMPLNLEAAIKFAEGLNCNIAEFSPRLAELLARGRKTDPRLDQYEIPDHELHALLGDFQRLGKTKRQEFLASLRAAVLSDREIKKRGMSTNYPTDKETERALNLAPSRLGPVRRRTQVRQRGQLSLFGGGKRKG